MMVLIKLNIAIILINITSSYKISPFMGDVLQKMGSKS